MLNTEVEEILYDESGKVSGIKATMKDREGEAMKFETKCRMIVSDPTYFPEKVRPAGHLLKAICILNHPIDKTDNSDSLQLIIPQSQVGRKHGKFQVILEGDHLLTKPSIQMSTLPSCLPHTMFALGATTSPLSAPLLRVIPTTISSCNLVSRDLVR